MKRALLVALPLVAVLVILWLVQGSGVPDRGVEALRPQRGLAGSEPADVAQPRAPEAGGAAAGETGNSREETGGPAVSEATEPPSIDVTFVVVDSAGTVVENCEVTCQIGTLFGKQMMLWDVVQERTGSDGEVSFRFLERERLQGIAPSLRAEGRTDDGRATDLLVLRLPLDPGPKELVLRPGGELFFRVVTDASGLPVAGAEVRVAPTDVLDSGNRIRRGTTDVKGELLVGPLAAGEYRTHVVAPSSDHAVTDLVQVADYQRHIVDVMLAGRGVALALAGVFLDANGQPTSDGYLWVGASDSALGEFVFPGEDGRFALYRATTEELHVSVAESVNSDRYEPESVSVPFGTQDLVLRSVETYPRRISRFRLIDEATGELAHGAGVALYFEDPFLASRTNQGFQSGDELWVEHADRPGLRWIAWAPGYELGSGEILEGEGLLEVLLERRSGETVRVRALDAADGSPVEGAIFRSQVQLATTDEEGWVELRTTQPLFSVSRVGYREEIWQHDPWGICWLERE